MIINSSKYYGHARQDLLALLPDGRYFKKALEIGCGEGRTGELLLKQNRVKWITGVEIIPEIADGARKRLNEVYCISIEQSELPFKQNEFDLILVADVLEHLLDPWQAMQRIVRLLHPGGYLLCSIPNVQHWRGIWAVLSGTWTYCEEGLFDIGHIRYFTRRSAYSLIINSGLRIERFRRNIVGRSKVVNFISFGLLADYCTRQFYFLMQRIDA